MKKQAHKSEQLNFYNLQGEDLIYLPPKFRFPELKNKNTKMKSGIIKIKYNGTLTKNINNLKTCQRKFWQH